MFFWEQIVYMYTCAYKSCNQTYFMNLYSSFSTIISSIKEIWNNEGISGFFSWVSSSKNCLELSCSSCLSVSPFSGLLPRLVGEWCLISICAIVTYHLNKYILGDRVAPDIKAYSPTLSHVSSCARVMFTFVNLQFVEAFLINTFIECNRGLAFNKCEWLE